MRFSQANWITIDARAQTIACERCPKVVDISRETKGVLHFVRAATRIARRHFYCADPGRRKMHIVEAVGEEQLGAALPMHPEDIDLLRAKGIAVGGVN
jgi:hypothetical protein